MLEDNASAAQVRLAEAFERFWARRADAHFCVTEAMRADLQASWIVDAAVFYDRPPPSFRPTAKSVKHALLMRLRSELATPMHPHDFCAVSYRSLTPGASVKQVQWAHT